MKRMIIMAVKYILYGISTGCTCFVVMCLAFSVWGGKEMLEMVFQDYTRQAVGSMIIGIACGGTAIVYQFQSLSWFWKRLIHFCVGMGVFYPVAVSLGWIPFYPDRIFYTILQILCSCGIFMAIWFCFYLFNRSEAKRINERLRELERENTGSQAEDKNFDISSSDSYHKER